MEKKLIDSNTEYNKPALSYSEFIARKINNYLIEQAVSLSDFALAMKTTKTEVSYWLTGKYNFTITLINKIQNVLDAPLLMCDLQNNENRLSPYCFSKEQHINECISYDLIFRELIIKIGREQ